MSTIWWYSTVLWTLIPLAAINFLYLPQKTKKNLMACSLRFNRALTVRTRRLKSLQNTRKFHNELFISGIFHGSYFWNSGAKWTMSSSIESPDTICLMIALIWCSDTRSNIISSYFCLHIYLIYVPKYMESNLNLTSYQQTSI